tara:strand:+ start:12609 stop:12914 length:306 start_codon:yes stop_codon:yes gene_type:complete
MLVKLTEICSNGAVTVGHKYKLREVFVNPEHVVLIREETRVRELNENGMLNLPGTDTLNKSHRFSKLTINRGHSGSEIVVVGAPDQVESSLKLNNRTVLRG